MTRKPAPSIVYCFLLASLLGSPAIALPLRPSVQQTSAERVESASQKPQAKTTKPDQTKAPVTSPKSTTTVTAKVTDKSGKRFWSRIMDAFRDVHSAEKKPKQ